MPDADLLRRALIESQLKLNPQGAMLRQLMDEARSGYGMTRRVNHSNEAAIKQATVEARPEVESAYDRALSSVSAQRAALGRPDDPQAAAYQRRVSEGRANGLLDLTQESLRATEGRVFANDQARESYLGTKQKIQGQQMNLAEQLGLMTSSTLDKLRDDQRDRKLEDRRIDVSEGNLTETQRHNRVSEDAAKKAAEKAKGKVAWQSPKDHAAAKAQIDQAVAYVNSLKGSIKSRKALIDTLTKGVPAGKDDDGSTLPAIPKFNADFVRAAMNIAFDGSLSRADLQRLHNQGLQLRRLGYQVRPPQGPRGTAGPRLRAGITGGAVGGVGR